MTVPKATERIPIGGKVVKVLGTSGLGRVVHVRTAAILRGARSRAQFSHVDELPPSGPPALSRPLIRDNFTADVDGVRVTFNTSRAFAVRTTMVYLNGLLQEEPADYVELGSLNGFTMDDPPQPGDRLIAYYEGS